jgi:dsRNA-specific ribonuclease
LPHVLLNVLVASAARVKIAKGAGTRGAGAVAPSQALAALEAALGYAFEHRELLELALVHPSASRLANNAPLAWAGDAVSWSPPIR